VPAWELIDVREHEQAAGAVHHLADVGQGGELGLLCTGALGYAGQVVLARTESLDHVGAGVGGIDHEDVDRLAVSGRDEAGDLHPGEHRDVVASGSEGCQLERVVGLHVVGYADELQAHVGQCVEVAFLTVAAGVLVAFVGGGIGWPCSDGRTGL
jgi:hypothetical protein